MVKDFIMAIDRTVVYGPGGFDTSKPNNNIVEIIEIEIPDEPIEEEANGTI